MKFSFFTGMGYAIGQKSRDWPVPPSRHLQENVQLGFDRAFGLFRLADSLGFDWVATPEHHFKPYLASNPMLTAAALSQIGLRAKVAILGVVATGRDPITVAEDAATVDQMLGGRFVIGLLRGFPVEQLTFGVTPAQRRALYEETVELILAAWEENEVFNWEGTYFRRGPIGVWPRAFNGVRPETLIAASNEADVDFAARLRLSIGMGHLPVADAAVLAERYRAAAANAGWTPTPDNIVYHCEIHVAETDKLCDEQIAQYGLGFLPDGLGARGVAGQRLRRAMNEPEEKHSDTAQNVLRFWGSPETMVDKLAAAQEAIGFGVINVIFQGLRVPPEIGRGSIELFGHEVMPQLRG